ncbi:hypothetical protein TRFO_02342 [Tritrichomonas foetus]|uniref:ATPase AAA-type core domain-containing protein n=1 Tax=Tritrichomonas foetus TaxID=1144522 RepID=A0A1J4J325_9EUKA|nr:hypothetical protein TRFO_02342 [Tritrichomonas foetus]|eukprot:OHS93822.1 hypothetical protein TRFO_02342 [Tritrichomonas foetus]
MPVDQAMTKLQQGFSTVLDHTPALLLIDDIGKLAGKSDSSTPTSVRRLRSFFVSLLDRALLVPGLVVVATANSRDEIDPNLLRFGRFAFETNLELPSSAQRAEILRLNTQGLHIEQEDIIKLAGKTTDGKNCENIENIAELGVYAMIKRNVSSNNEFPTDNEIVQSSNSQLLLTYFPVNIIDDVPRLNTGGHSHESGLTIMDMMGGKSSNKMHNSGDPLAGNIGMGLGDDSDGGLFGKMSKQPGTTGGMAPINMGSLFGGGSPSKPSSETDMFGRPIQKTETDMFGRVKSNSPQPTSPPSSNDISPPGDNADMFGRPKENASSNDGDSSNNQSDPFAGFGSPNINPFGAQASSKPEQPNDPFGGFGTFGGGEESKSNAQQNDPFDGFGSNTGQSNPFGSFGSPNNQANEPQKEEEKAQNNPFGGFGSSNNSGFGSENSKESKQEEKPNPFSSPSYSSSNSTPPDPFANFGFGGSTSQNQPEEPKANDQPVNPSSTQPSNEPDPFANYGSPNQPSNPFAAPPEEPNQTEQKPFVSFGTKSTKFAPQESSQAGDSRDQFADFRQGSNSAAQQQPDPFAPSQPESSQTNQQSDPFANNSFGGAQSGDPTPQPNPFANNGFGSSSAPTNQPDPFASNGFGAASQTTNSAAPTNQPDPFASNGFGAASQTTNSAAPTNQLNPFASNGFGASSQPTQSIQQDPFGAGGFGGQQSQNNNNQQQVPFATNGFGGAPTPNPGIQQDPFAAGGFGGQSQPQQPVQDPFGGQVAPSPASQPQFGSGGFGANPQFGQGGFAQPSPFMQQNRRNAPVMLGGGGIRDMFYEGGGNNQPQSNPLAQQQQAQQPVEYTPMITPNVPEEAKKEVKPTIDIFGERPHSKPQPLDSLSSQSQQPAQQQQQQMQNQQIQNQQMQNQQMQQNQFRGGAGGYGSGYGGGMPYNNYGGAGYGMMGNNAGYNDPFNAPPANNFGGGYGGAPVGFNASPAAFGGYNAGNQYGGGGYGGFNGAPSGFGGAPSGGFGGNQPQAGSGGGFGNQQQIQQNKPQADDPFDKYNPLK